MLYNQQEKEWNPLLAWFEAKYDITVPLVESSIIPTPFTKYALDKLKSVLDEYSIEALHGLHFGVSSIQSVILTLAVVEQRINVEQAIHLSRLETRFQVRII